MLLWALTLLACSAPADQTVQTAVEQTFPAPYVTTGTDVILIVLDTLRADHLSQYGYALSTSPGLARLSASATRFENARSPSPWTLPSTASIHTGLHPLRHGMRHPGDALGEAVHPLAERLRDAGWHTQGFSHNVSVSPRHGFAQGFDTFTHNTGKVLGYPNVRRMTKVAADWLSAAPSGPALVYLQPMNCHGPYKVPDSHESDLLGRKPRGGFQYYHGLMGKILRGHDIAARERVRPEYLQSLVEQYDTSIRYETDEVGSFLDSLLASGRFDNALIILTADHGEELFDHGGFSHGYSLNDEVLHVPLWVKLPGQHETRTVPDTVSLLDVLPTILEVTGVPASPGEGFDGRSLKGLAEGGTREAAPLVYDVDWRRRVVGHALAEEGWKLLEIESNYEGLDHVSRLYHLATDPGETEDLAGADPARVEAMHVRLAALVAGLSVGAAAPENHLNDEDTKQLEALGYLE